MSVRSPNNIGGAVQTDPTLLRYASAITEQKKCSELPAQKFDRFQTLRNNSQQDATTCNRVCKRIQHCCATLWRSRNKRIVGSCWLKSLTGFKLCATTPNKTQQHATGCANGSNIVALRFGDHGTKELLGVVGWKVWPGFKLCATTSNNMQQGVQTDATCNIQQCWELLANDNASVCTGLKTHLTGHKHAPTCFFHSCGNVLYEKKNKSIFQEVN